MNLKKVYEEVKIKIGEVPKTKFIDNINAVKVTLIDYPDEERIKKVFVNFSTSSWYSNYCNNLNEEEIHEEIKELLTGKTLGLGIETAQFTFLVEGLSLHGSHALVRNRIGITYAQQSQAVRDYRHSYVLVPRAYTKYPELLERYKKWVIEGKRIYSDLLDTNDISINDARLSLPKTLPVWIYVSCNLMTLISLLSKRLDTQEESIEMNVMANQMRNLVIEKFPYLKDFLLSSCEKKRCFHQQKGYTSNCIFKRDKLHEIEGYVDEFTLHNKTKEELSKGEEYKSEEYIGDKKQ